MVGGHKTHTVKASAEGYHHSITMDEAESIVVKARRAKFRKAVN